MHVLYCIIQCMKIKTPRSQFCTCISVSNKTYMYVTLDILQIFISLLYKKTKNTLGPTFTYMCIPRTIFQFCSYFTFVSVLLSFTLGPWGPTTVQGREGLTRYKQFAIIVHQMYSVQVPSGSTQGHNTNKLRIEHSLQGSNYRTIAPQKKQPLQYMHPLFFCRIVLSTELVSCQRKVGRVIDMWVFPGLLAYRFWQFRAIFAKMLLDASVHESWLLNSQNSLWQPHGTTKSAAAE